jgi:hypothetical protein
MSCNYVKQHREDISYFCLNYKLLTDFLETINTGKRKNHNHFWAFSCFFPTCQKPLFCRSDGIFGNIGWHQCPVSQQRVGKYSMMYSVLCEVTTGGCRHAQDHVSITKWLPVSSMQYFWPGPIGFWSQVVHYIGNRVPLGIEFISGPQQQLPASLWGPSMVEVQSITIKRIPEVNWQSNSNWKAIRGKRIRNWNLSLLPEWTWYWNWPQLCQVSRDLTWASLERSQPLWMEGDICRISLHRPWIERNTVPCIPAGPKSCLVRKMAWSWYSAWSGSRRCCVLAQRHTCSRLRDGFPRSIRLMDWGKKNTVLISETIYEPDPRSVCALANSIAVLVKPMSDKELIPQTAGPQANSLPYLLNRIVSQCLIIIITLTSAHSAHRWLLQNGFTCTI